MTVEQSKQYYRDRLVWKSFRPSQGGQSTGVVYNPITLECDELSFIIEIGYYRSQFKNRELALLIFELFLDHIVKYFAKSLQI